MCLKIFCASLFLHGSIALCSCIVQQHRLIEQFEPLDLLDCPLGSLSLIKDYESLAFCFEVRLGDKFDDIAVFREDFGKGFFELVRFDTFFQILDLYYTSVCPISSRSDPTPRHAHVDSIASLDTC